jgi:hypothetical protein
MNTQEIVTLFRIFADEPDETFVSNPQAALYCKLGYDQFLNHISEINPYATAQTANITLTAQNVYDLTQANAIATAATTPSILGSNPNNNTVPIGRMTKLLAVYLLDAANNVSRVFQVVNSQTALRINRSTCQLRGTNLHFGFSVAGNFQILYSAEQTVGRTNPTVANQEPTWVTVATGAIPAVNLDDNMQIFHDMIPLFAMQQYDIQNGVQNVPATGRLAERKRELQEYLAQRDYAGVHYVVPVYDPTTGMGRSGIF